MRSFRPVYVIAGLLLMVPSLALAADKGVATGTPLNDSSVDTYTSTGGRSESLTVHGKRSLPPGYAPAPSVEMKHGPDPDHPGKVTRDPVTGANVSRFGTAYQDRNPVSQGSLGDATGNGWIAPRQN